MFIGHYAVGLAAKKFAPKTSLGLLIAAPIFLDLIWPIFLLFGWEHVRIDPGNTAVTPLDFFDYPYSHSLLATLVWASLFAGFYFSVTRYISGTLWIWIGVVSHWLLDAIVHRPDLPLYPGSAILVGGGLWNHVTLTFLLENFLFLTGMMIYLRVTAPQDRIGKYGFWSFALFLIFGYAGSLFAPPPPSTTAIAMGTLMTWLFPVWAWWFDQHRIERALQYQS
ncbi:MAG: hypothetical protein HY200_00210 [Nitrospirae bacterium]|nr:hypothetical protein [Nitrospirota bacterium]MBI3593360.1 hypothetical protein [Nitrospirota bacterium]